MEGLLPSTHHYVKQRVPHQSQQSQNSSHNNIKQNHVSAVVLYGVPIVSLMIENQERLCLAQISNTLLKEFSYNEIHNRRVALGITCVQCTPVQLEILRRAGAMPVSSRRCGMITRREAERLCKSFLGDNAPPRLPDDFAFSVHHECAWGCRGAFLPSRYNSSRAKCIKCCFCGLFFSPNKFIFHSHRTSPNATYVQPDAANFNSWRRHMKLSGSPPENITHAWEDVKAMFNGGTRKRMMSSASKSSESKERKSPQSPLPIKQMKLSPTSSSNAGPVIYPSQSPTSSPIGLTHRVPPYPDIPLPISVMDYMWDAGIKAPYPFSPYLPWLNSAKRSMFGLSNAHSLPSSSDVLPITAPTTSKMYHQSAFRPVYPLLGQTELHCDLKRFSLLESKNAIDTESSDCEGRDDIIICNDSTAKTLKVEIQDDSNDSNSTGQLKRNCGIFELRNNNFVARNNNNSPEYIAIAEDYSTKKKDYPNQITLSKTEEDENVDIETTDELDAQPVLSDSKFAALPRNKDCAKVSPKHKIWTIARYSEEDKEEAENHQNSDNKLQD